MKKTFYLLLILLLSISCSYKNVPFGLKRTINQIDKNLNDTIKYDFKIAPENLATSKHHFGLGLDLRNGKGLWRGSLLKTYFKLNGIKHPDDMSSIILTTYHRKLNNQPINFNKQKEEFKEYWKMSEIGNDTFKKWWDLKYQSENNDSINKKYYSQFKKDRMVLGSIYSMTPFEDGSASGTDIKMIGKIIEQTQNNLKIKIINLGKVEDGFKAFNKVGDTIDYTTYNVFLIPTLEK